MRLQFKAIIFIALGAVAQAGSISFLDQFKNLDYTQTGNGNTITFANAFYSADINTTTPSPYTSASFTFPGPSSPLSLSPLTTTDYHYQTAALPTQAAMDAAFPFGTYTFTGNPGADTASYAYSADDYAQSNPFLTGTDYSSLQGMNPSLAFTFHFNPFATGGSATSSLIFFTITDLTTHTTVYNSGFLPATTASLTVAGGTFAPGDTFDYQVDYSNRDSVASLGAQFEASLGFDIHTDGTFTTGAAIATPEPSSVALVGFAVLAGGVILAARGRWRTR